MKKILTMFLTAALLLSSLTCLFPLGVAQAAMVNDANTATQYTYEIIPLLEPFNEYFFVKTDNPDPKSFRFIDHSSVYAEEGEEAIIAQYAYAYSDEEVYADVVYEDESIQRVKGGYIFESFYTDGGEIVLQTASSYDYWGRVKEWADTNVKLTIPKLCDEIDYLINTYTNKGDSFFDQMDAVQKGLNSICRYNGNYVRGTLYQSDHYWYLYRSPYVDTLYYIYTPYSRNDNRYLLATTLYPFRHDSLGFPSVMALTALRLSNEADYKWSSSNHYLVDVTYNGVTRSYGGAGTGEGQGLSEDKLTKFFTFGDDDMDITLEGLKKLQEEYSAVVMEDDIPRENGLTWKDINDTVGYEGAWVSMANGFTFLYKRNDNDYYNADEFAGVGHSLYWGGSLGYLTNAWIDGRHISKFSMLDPGATFEEYPKDSIVLTDFTYPVISYQSGWQYNWETGSYEFVYKNVEVTEKTGILRYDYSGGDSNTWEVLNYESYDPETGSWITSGYSVAAELAESGLIDEKYAEMLHLTYEQVAEMKVDRNTDLDPEQGYNYSNSSEPGTPFDRTAINSEDPDVLFTEAKQLAEENGLSFRLDEGHYGMIGNDMYWVHLQESKTLIITGTGDMMTLCRGPWYFNDITYNTILVGEGVESIQDRAFYAHSEVTSIRLPSTLKKIGWWGFEDISVTSIEIPASVEEMGKEAFKWCSYLQDIYCLAESQPEGWNEDWLGDCTATVHWGTAMPVPCKHTNTKTDRKEATCTTTGYENVLCTDCGETVSHTLIPALGHAYEDGVCTVCGVSENTRPLGDINGDGNIDSTDYLLLKRFCLGSRDLTDEQKAVADVNKDGKINSLDYLMLKRHVLETYVIG